MKKSMQETNIQRRNFFKVGLTTAGVMAGAQGLAQICGLQTGAQPLGPFFPNEGTPLDPVRENTDSTLPISLANDSDLTFVRGRTGRATGQVVYLSGQVTNESCEPIARASIVIWQAAASGRYNHRGDADNHDFEHPVTGEIIKRTHDPYFQYWGRTLTDENGGYNFKTIVPGFYPADLRNKWYRPPHIHFMVSATGYPQFVTQSYFRGEHIVQNDFYQELNERDLLLQSPNLNREQREKLIVDFSPDATGLLTDGLLGRFDIQLKR
jgi:protocatechuate 3,4-dioxygenase beta subunit